jgi:hypothetical protein
MTSPEQASSSAQTVEPGLLSVLSREHLPLIAGLLSTFLVAFRILSVARWDPETAYAILRSAGASSVILGVALSVVGYLALLVFVICERSLRLNGHRYSTSTQDVIIALLVLSAGWSLYNGPVVVVVPLAVLLGVRYVPLCFRRALMFVRRRRGAAHDKGSQGQTADQVRKRKRPRWLEIVTVILAVVVALLAVAIAPPWMPAESLTLRGARPVAVYVLSVDNGYLTVLTAISRRVKYVRQISVSARGICVDRNAISPLNDSFAQLFGAGRSRYPVCPNG